MGCISSFIKKIIILIYGWSSTLLHAHSPTSDTGDDVNNRFLRNYLRHHSSPSSVMVKNEWWYTSTPSYAFMAGKGTTCYLTTLHISLTTTTFLRRFQCKVRTHKTWRLKFWGNNSQENCHDKWVRDVQHCHFKESVKTTFQHCDIKHIWDWSHHNRKKDGLQMQPMSCLLNGFYTDHVK